MVSFYSIKYIATASNLGRLSYSVDWNHFESRGGCILLPYQLKAIQ